jgi:hypothetical protein
MVRQKWRWVFPRVLSRGRGFGGLCLRGPRRPQPAAGETEHDVRVRSSPRKALVEEWRVQRATQRADPSVGNAEVRLMQGEGLNPICYW